MIVGTVTLVTDIAPQMNILESADLEFQEVTMSMLHQTDVFQPEQKAARKHHEYGFALALFCVVLAVVVASVMFIDAFRPNGPTSALALRLLIH